MSSLARSRTLGVGFLLCSGFVANVQSKSASEILAVFDKPIQLFGNMTINDIDFVDGLKINVYSPINREVTVTMNNNPLNGTFVTGTTGSGYRTVRGYSYVFKTNPPGNDMIAKITIPYDPTRLQNVSIDQADTFVGKLADDKKAWMVMSSQQTVQRAVFKTSMSQLTSLDGEYALLGRRGTDNGNIFIPYGMGAQFSANFTGGPGRQDVEFIDGLRFAVQSEFPLRMNVDLKFPLTDKEIPQGMMSLNPYAWVVNTTGRVELMPAPLPAAPSNGTIAPIGAPPNPNAALPAPINSASPFTFASPRRRQQAPGAQPQPIAQPQPMASGSPDLPQTASPVATLVPAAPGAPTPPVPAPPAPPSSSGMPAPPAPGAPAPPGPGSPGNPPPDMPEVAPGNGILTAGMIDFPLNVEAVRAMMRTNPGQGNANPATALSDPQLLSQIKFTVGRRPTGADPNAPFTPIPMAGPAGTTPNGGNAGAAAGAQNIQVINGRLVFQGVTQLDGEYVILIPVDAGRASQANSAKAGLIKENSAVEIRAGAAMGALAVAVWFMFLL